MSTLKKRIIFWLGIVGLVAFALLIPGQAGSWITLSLIFVVAVSTLYLVIADYVRSRQAKHEGTGSINKQDLFDAVAEDAVRRKRQKP